MPGTWSHVHAAQPSVSRERAVPRRHTRLRYSHRFKSYPPHRPVFEGRSQLAGEDQAHLERVWVTGRARAGRRRRRVSHMVSHSGILRHASDRRRCRCATHGDATRTRVGDASERRARARLVEAIRHDVQLPNARRSLPQLAQHLHGILPRRCRGVLEQRAAERRELVGVASPGISQHRTGLGDRAACRHAAAEEDQRLVTHGKMKPVADSLLEKSALRSSAGSNEGCERSFAQVVGGTALYRNASWPFQRIAQHDDRCSTRRGCRRLARCQEPL